MEHTSQDSMPALLPELIRVIFSFTNVETVIFGMMTSRTLRTMLGPICQKMMRPPNFRMQLCGKYQDSKCAGYQFFTSEGEPYILGHVDSRYPVGHASDEEYRGFTCMCVLGYKEDMLFFGYSQYCYVMYRFQYRENRYIYTGRCIV